MIAKMKNYKNALKNWRYITAFDTFVSLIIALKKAWISICIFIFSVGYVLRQTNEAKLLYTTYGIRCRKACLKRISNNLKITSACIISVERCKHLELEWAWII